MPGSSSSTTSSRPSPRTGCRWWSRSRAQRPERGAATHTSSSSSAERSATGAWDLLQVALALRGAEDLASLGLPARTLSIDVDARSVCGVEVPTLGPPPPVLRSLAVRDQDVWTPCALSEAATTAFERLGAQLVHTTRQVNRLEQRVAPDLSVRRSEIRRTLEEREREDHVRARLLAARRRE